MGLSENSGHPLLVDQHLPVHGVRPASNDIPVHRPISICGGIVDIHLGGISFPAQFTPCEKPGEQTAYSFFRGDPSFVGVCLGPQSGV